MDRRQKINLAAAVVCIGMVLWAIYYAQGVLGLEPCPLCMFQRVCIAALGVVFLVAALHPARRIGSIVVADAAGRVEGILTRYDVLGRIALPGVSLDTPVAQVMVQPVHTLSAEHTAQDAALLMSRHGIRHVPVTRGGRLVGLVSERDLFAMQRLSLKQVGTAIRAAADVPTLRLVAQDIRRFARNLLGQGVQARQLTELISHLNDVLTARLVELVARQRGLNLERACWLAFGSEGRGEQTIATDQDNGLAFDSPSPDADRPAWQALGHEVNQRLADCGYPLCSGGVMAGARRFQATLGPFPAAAKRLTFQFHCEHPGCDGRAPCCTGESQKINLSRTRSLGRRRTTARRSTHGR